MITENFWLPLPVENLERLFIDTFEYRLHKIKITTEEKAHIAHVYDGPVQVFETRGSDTEQALRDAKKWIDEQDEVASVYDL